MAAAVVGMSVVYLCEMSSSTISQGHCNESMSWPVCARYTAHFVATCYILETAVKHL